MNGYPRDMVGYGEHPPHAAWPNGARLALEQWGHRVRYGPGGRRGSYHIYLRQLNDAAPATGDYSPSLPAANAQAASSNSTPVSRVMPGWPSMASNIAV